MAQTSTVSFSNPLTAPFQIQAQNLQQQQALAQAMLQQGMQPINPNRVASGGLEVPISPLEGLAHMGQALAGALMNRNVDNNMMDLSNKQSAFMMHMLAPQPIYADNTQAATPAPAAAASSTSPDVDPSGDLARLTSDPSIYQGASASQPVISANRGNAGAATPEPPAVAPDAGQQLASAIMGGMNFSPSAGTDTVANPVTNDAASPVPQALARQIVGYQQSPLNPMGMPATTAAYMMGTAPDQYWKQVGAMYAPTDLMKTMAAAGIDPRSTLGQQILQQNVAKTNYIAPTPLRDGAPYLTPDGMLHTTPNSANGTMMVADPTSPTGFKVVQIPGATDAIAAHSTAEAKGKAHYNVVSGYRNGQPVYTTAENIADGGAGAAPGVKPGGRFGGYTAPNGPVTPSLSPAEQASSTEMAKIGTDRYKAIQASATDSKDRVSMLDNMINLSNQTQFGPGSGKKFSLYGTLNTLGIPVHTNDVENYQEFKKYAINLGAAASKALGGTGTDKQLETMLEGNPNPEMLSKVINNVGTYLKSRELAVQAHANFVDAQTRGGNNVTNINQLEAQWRKNYNPQAFQQLTQISMLPQQKAAQYVNGLRKSNPRLYQQINTAAQYLQQ